jgi:pseudaminic acid cytidylyltransferase
VRIAIIPARGGSKRIPRKNIRSFHGRPMIAYAIEATRSSQAFDAIVVSTDDEEICRIAHEYGAQTPFQRPAVLADDHAGTLPVIRHAIDECQALGWAITDVCCVYPCVPLLDATDLQQGLALFDEHPDRFVFPVTRFPSAIQRALRLFSDARTGPMWPEFELSRSQDLEPAFYDAGQFYFGSRDAWLTKLKVHSNGVGLEIPYWRVVDIDTMDDWERAETLYELRDAAGRR